MSSNLVIVALIAFVVLANGNPIDSLEGNDIILCAEGASSGLIDGVLIYPNEQRCRNIGGMCVESDKCKSLVSAKGLCPSNQKQGVECCFELEPQYEPCHFR